MKIYIMRHGQAGMNPKTDEQRPLTEQGIEESIHMAGWLAPQLTGSLSLVIHSNYLRARQTWQAISAELPEALKVEESRRDHPLWGSGLRGELSHRAGGDPRQYPDGQSPAPGRVSGAKSLPGGRCAHVCHLGSGLYRVARWQGGLALAGRTAYNTIKVNKKLHIGFLGKRESIFPVFYTNLTELSRISCCHTDTTARGCKR